MADTKPTPKWIEDKVPIREFVCVGQRRSTSGKLTWFFVPREDLDAAAFGLDLKGNWPGRIVKLAMTDDGTWYPASVEYAGTLQDERVAQWDIAHRTVQTAEQMRLREARDKREANDLGAYTLEQLRESLGNMTYPHRAALMGQVLAYLQRT